ncbi:hypothetical protein GCM10027026_31590 [Myroides odoratimimus subsp. xuanwuensis]
MIELETGSQWLTGSEAAAIAGISPAALRQRRTREAFDRHPRYMRVGAAAVLYPADEFAGYAATWLDKRQQTQASR